MLELMMQAQAQAKKEQEQQVDKEIKQSFTTGFKKGFLDTSSNPKVLSPASVTSKPKPAGKSVDKAKDVKAESLATTSGESIPTITKKKDTLLIDEVQTNIKADESPILQQLQGGGKQV
jgi:hypothetical protein